jgi:hypothetical protein
MCGDVDWITLRNIGFSDFVHRPKTQYFCVLYTIVRTL